MLIWRNITLFYCFKRPARHPVVDLPDKIAKIHHRHEDDVGGGTTLHPPSGNYHVLKRGQSARLLFNWGDHPALVTDAFENGWFIFGFTSPPPQFAPPSLVRSSSVKVLLRRLCVAGERERDREREPLEVVASEPEISWEVSQSSADFMQKIRLNPPGVAKRRLLNLQSAAAVSVIRTALPLPGPPLGNNLTSAFRQEAYFEITISSGGEDRYQSSRRSSSAERIKLIPEVGSSVDRSSNSAGIQELKVLSKDEKKSEGLSVAVGLSVGSATPPFKLPGTYPGSIAFNSNGSVYLDGLKLGAQSEALEWTRERVMGCGFEPKEKKVYFTVDSEVVHTIQCNSDEFGTPLYPIIAANSEVVVVVNLGQSAFSYEPANAARTPNPCFIGPLVKSGAAAAAANLGYEEDSKELFSMGKIDSQWLNRSATKYPFHNFKNLAEKECGEGEESEAELFEIMLDSFCGQSPNNTTTSATATVLSITV